MRCATASSNLTLTLAVMVTENKEVKAMLPLEIYGVMANMGASELITATRSIDTALEALGNHNEGRLMNKLNDPVHILGPFRLHGLMPIL